MHPRCRQAPPWLARPFSEVHCQSRGPGGYPGRTDRRQGHALRAPDSELTTSVPVPSMRVPPHWASSEEAVMQYARIQVLPDIPPGGVCAGIDWASKDHVACVVDMAGRVTDRFSAAHDKAGIAGMIARLRRSGAAEVAIERSDGVLVGALLAAGLTVVVITSRQVRNLRSRYGSRRPTSCAPTWRWRFPPRSACSASWTACSAWRSWPGSAARTPPRGWMRTR